MTSILPVPYKSQWDADAGVSRDDCGPACVAMVLTHYDMPKGTDEVFAATGAGVDAYVTMAQMRRAAEQLGLPLTYHTGRSLDDLREWLDQGRPVIALVKYGVWSSLGLTWDDFTGPHFVVVVGYDDQGNILVNDPDYRGARRLEGDHKPYPAELFRQAWYGLDPADNPQGAALVPEAPPPSSESLSVFGPPTMTRPSFCARLGGSPMAGREAELAYTMCEAYGVDPAFPLALFFHASRLGTEGDTLAARNPGLLKHGSDGVDIGLTLPMRGRVQRYHAWLDGWRALLQHLVVHHLARGRRSVAHVLPVWDTDVDAGAMVGVIEETMRSYGGL